MNKDLLISKTTMSYHLEKNKSINNNFIILYIIKDLKFISIIKKIIHVYIIYIKFTLMLKINLNYIEIESDCYVN